jgi:hypothetical protein
MRTSNYLILAIGIICLSACAGLNSANLAPNTINEPVFHKETDMSLGISRIQWNDPASKKNSNDGIFNLSLRADFPLNEWAGLSLPLYLNFLLTGEQYRDGIHLRTGDLNLAVGAGFTDFTILEWKSPFAVGAQAKYLFDRYLFAKFVIGTETAKLADLHNGQSWTCLSVGSQLSDEIAIIAAANLNRVFASPFHYFEMHGVQVYDGDLTTTTGMTLDWYPTSKHVFSASVNQFSLLNSQNPASRWLFSGQYRYVFGGN